MITGHSEMKITVGKTLVVCLCMLVASGSCFQKHIQTLTAKVNRLFWNDQCDSVSSTCHPDIPPPAVSQCDDYTTDDKHHLFGIDWRNVCSKIANNWWIIAVSSLLPFIVFWRIQYNMRQKVNVQ